MSKKIEEPIEIFTITKKKFDKLTPVQKRIAVAQDVIDRINLNQLIGSSGAFMRKLEVPKELNKQTQLSELLKSPKTKCEVCAKGGLFMSFVGIVNSYEIAKGMTHIDNGYHLDSDEMQKLSEIFSEKQLTLIETAFEKTTYGWNEQLTGEQISKCVRFGEKFEHDNDRLLAICENIIKNKGTFKP